MLLSAASAKHLRFQYDYGTNVTGASSPPAEEPVYGTPPISAPAPEPEPMPEPTPEPVTPTPEYTPTPEPIEPTPEPTTPTEPESPYATYPKNPSYARLDDRRMFI